MLAINIESRLNFFCISYLVHSQIWLNLPKDDRHFSYIFFLCMTITEATLKKKNTGVDRRMGGHPPARPTTTCSHIPNRRSTGRGKNRLLQVGVGFHVPLPGFVTGRGVRTFTYYKLRLPASYFPVVDPRMDLLWAGSG
jgi:hypothetical protein